MLVLLSISRRMEDFTLGASPPLASLIQCTKLVSMLLLQQMITTTQATTFKQCFHLFTLEKIILVIFFQKVFVLYSRSLVASLLGAFLNF